MKRVLLTLLVFSLMLVYMSLSFMGCDSDPSSTGESFLWREISVLPDSADSIPIGNLYSIAFPSEETGWIAGVGGRVFRTNDMGETWELMYYNESIWLFDVFSIDNATIWGAGMTGSYPYNAVIINSTDSGATWTVVPLLNINAQLSCIRFTDSENGYAVGGSWPHIHDDRLLLYTFDGGATWDTTYSYVDSAISAINDDDTSYYYINSISIDSIDIDISLIDKVDDSRFFDLDFGGPNSGCIVGADNMIMTSNDVDSLWGISDSLPIPSVTFEGGIHLVHLYGVDMIDDLNGWAVGSFSLIMKTSDGGTRWTVQYIDSTNFNSLQSVSFLDENNGVAVGDGGKVFITDDAGSTWGDISYISPYYGNTPINDNDLSDVVYLSLGKIVIVAEDMLVLISK